MYVCNHWARRKKNEEEETNRIVHTHKVDSIQPVFGWKASEFMWNIQDGWLCQPNLSVYTYLFLSIFYHILGEWFRCVRVYREYFICAGSSLKRHAVPKSNPFEWCTFTMEYCTHSDWRNLMPNAIICVDMKQYLFFLFLDIDYTKFSIR